MPLDPGEAQLANDNEPMAMEAEAVRTRLRVAVSEAGGLRAWAVAHGVSHGLVSEILSGRREPSGRVLGPLGLRRLEHRYGAALEASA